jgi:hypothetical protein
VSEITTRTYWEARYQGGGNSGVGSYGRLADFKAEILNDFAEKHNVKIVAELGCGDGNQLSLYRFDQYIGLDISTKAIEICSQKFAADKSKRFIVYVPEALGPKIRPAGQMAISLDVVYHLLEDSTYNSYLNHLFQLADRFVAIYANNTEKQGVKASHLLYHKFTNWVLANRPDWKLTGFVPNRYPWDPNKSDVTSISNFYFFSRGEKLAPRFAIYQPQWHDDTEAAEPQKSPRDLMAEAQECLKSGNLDETRRSLDKVLSVAPNNQTALNNLGLIAFSQGDCQTAEQAFKAILAQDDENEEGKKNLAKLYLQEKRWDDLRTFLNELPKLKETNKAIAKFWPTLCEIYGELDS